MDELSITTLWFNAPLVPCFDTKDVTVTAALKVQIRFSLDVHVSNEDDLLLTEVEDIETSDDMTVDRVSMALPYMCGRH